MDTIRRFLPFFRPFYGRGAVLALALLATSVISIITPFLYQRLIDHGILAGSIRTVYLMVLIIAVTLIVQELLTLAQTAITLSMRQSVFLAIRQQLYMHLLTLTQGYFAERHKGGLLSRLSHDVTAVQRLFLDQLVYFLRNTIVALGIFGILLTLQWKMVLTAGLFMPLLCVLYLFFRHRISTRSRTNQEQQELLMARWQEDLSVVKAIQAFAVAKERMRATMRYMVNAERARRDLDMQYAIAASATIVLNVIGLVVVWGIGALEVMAGRLTIGMLVAISFFLNHIINLFYSAYYSVVELQGAIPAAERIWAILDIKPVIADSDNAVEIDTRPQSVKLENVTFAYGKGRPVLKGVSAEFYRGEVIVVTGDSGQGKTTLANLLQRLVDPQAGRITFDGLDIRQVKLDTLRRMVAVVPQEELLLYESLRDNITLQRPNITEAQFRQASARAQVDRYAARLPQGYDTIVGERGARLSEGQKKRIAIARALLEDPFILILDEATSVLDEPTEQAILASIVNHSAHRVVFIITHKKSNFSYATQIVRIDDGQMSVQAAAVSGTAPGRPQQECP